ncbi:MAG: cysteine desulfurase [Rhizobiales bacterium]|nr:cysteine desulfurase [Hyphomicrobiales bacterium]MBO6698229.1 cysteine desulfurase [Hyphomicrobiales bacterium]MBO6735517.1 cysteine desulfurase [Hyphomicrobiales bacterium]MBO6910675.1 cysteine desulfurase [Hyphomicrobiales bacterium]MBO6956045.1 cysteine desulfurase [Hyphomicrobiales bacterium]
MDVAAVRADFPALSTQVNGKPLVYLDNAASAQKPNQVIDGTAEFYRTSYANVHRGLHHLSTAATEAYEGARAKVARFLGAASDQEIVFTRSVTEALNLVAHGLGESIQEGDEIILSVMEHHSNIVPWHYLREKKGAVLKWVPVLEDGSFDVEAFESMVTERTKIVALTHMSNVLGTVTPIRAVADYLADRPDITLVVDGAQGAVHMAVDVQALGCDFYAVTGHKLYGPSGIGALWGKAEKLADLPPYMGGGEMIDEVREDGMTYAPPPARFEAGTPPIAQAVGLGLALDYIEAIGRDAISAHEHELLTYAMEKIRQINAVRIMGEAPGKGAIISFEVEGAHAHDISTLLDRSGVAVRAGTHCAQPLLKRYGVSSSCRASFGVYNTFEEVDTFVEALKKAQSFFT